LPVIANGVAMDRCGLNILVAGCAAKPSASARRRAVRRDPSTSLNRKSQIENRKSKTPARGGTRTGAGTDQNLAPVFELNLDRAAWALSSDDFLFPFSGEHEGPGAVGTTAPVFQSAVSFERAGPIQGGPARSLARRGPVRRASDELDRPAARVHTPTAAGRILTLNTHVAAAGLGRSAPPVSRPFSPATGHRPLTTFTELPMQVWARILSSRKVWVAIAAVAGCVITILGADPQKWTPLISSIVTLATVVIAAIGFEDASAKFGAGPQATGETPATPPSNEELATIRKSIGLILLLPLLCVSIGGCVAVDPISVQADEQREHALQPVVAEFQVNHPEQAQTWADFMRAWERSIEARKAWSAK
jgi:hypothetical protein